MRSQYLRQHAADYARLQDDPARATGAIRSIADDIDRQVVGVLADPDQQRLMAARGRSMALPGLAPRLNGLVEGDTLTFVWRTAAGTGGGVMRSTPDGSRVDGTRGNGDRTAGAGRWTGTRGR